MSAHALVLENVGVRFGGLKAVDGVSLTVAQGERRALIGPNGAGKTTLFNAISGVIRPSSGRVLFEGRDITSSPPHRRAALGIGRTFQITNLFPNLTIQDNMELAIYGLLPRKFAFFAARALSSAQEEIAGDALRLARIDAPRDTRVTALSYGVQRQLELAMALASRPKLLLLDEPAAGLSPSERAIVTDVIKSLPQTLSIVLIEHDMDLVLSLVDWVTCLSNGRLLAEGSPDSIRDNKDVQDVYLGRARLDA